jgi:hypothetical protein
LLLLLLPQFTGCASATKQAKANARNIDWNSRVGSYSYADATAEFGKPDFIEESGDGRVAEWVLHRSPRVSFGIGVGSGSYGGGVGTGVGVGTSVTPRPRGEYLRLAFDTDEKLSAWSLIKY